jgi:hypothetical protein
VGTATPSDEGDSICGVIHGGEEVADQLGPLISDAVGQIRNDRDRSIMQRRLGLLDGPTTLKSIGDVYGISHERVRQIESRALARLEKAQRTGSAGAALSSVVSYLRGFDSD